MTEITFVNVTRNAFRKHAALACLAMCSFASRRGGLPLAAVPLAVALALLPGLAAGAAVPAVDAGDRNAAVVIAKATASTTTNPVIGGAESQNIAPADVRELQSMLSVVIEEGFGRQLRQLDENGLQSIPLYADLTQSRDEMLRLANRVLPGTLQRLQSLTDHDTQTRPAILAETRQQLREVATAVLVERQKVRRRMRVGQFTAEVQQLVELQSANYERCRSLPSLLNRERTLAMMPLTETQRDVQVLSLQLTESLAEIATWQGEIGVTAGAGLQVLRAARIDDETVAAVKHLVRLDLKPAVKSQRAILNGFEALLRQLANSHDERLQAALRLTKELLERQTQLRQETTDLVNAAGGRSGANSKVAGKEAAKAELTELQRRQVSVRTDLDRLEGTIETLPAAKLALQEGKAASQAAAERLGANQASQAEQPQRETLRQLQQLHDHLQQALQGRSDRSAAELAKALEQLRQLRTAQEAVATQHQATLQQLAESDRETTASLEQQAAQLAEQARHSANVAHKLEQLGQQSQAWPDVASRLRQAAEANDRLAESAAELNSTLKQLEQTGGTNDTSAKASETRALADGQRASLATKAKRAERATRRAGAEIQYKAERTRRQALAVKIGEVARAAEALERAAASQQRLADAISQRQQDGQPLDAETRQQLAEENAKVRDLASKVAESLTGVTESASSSLSRAEEAMDELGRLAASGSDLPELSAADASPIDWAAKASQQAAYELAKAAQALRMNVGNSAQQLSRVAGQQLKVADQALESVGELQSQTPSVHAAHDLRGALEHVEQAMVAQLLAMGHRGAARCMATLFQVDGLRELQQGAQLAERQAVMGRTTTWLQAALAYQSLADAAWKMSETADADLAEMLRNVATQANNVAQQLLANNIALADTYRQRAAEQLSAALELTRRQVAQAFKFKADEPVSRSQREVAAQTSQASERLSSTTHAEMCKDLTDVELGAEQIAKQIEGADRDSQASQTRTAQLESQRRLERIRQAMHRLLQDELQAWTSEMHQHGEQASQVARQIDTVSPEAAAAIGNAADESQVVVDPNVSEGTATESQVRKDLKQAEERLFAERQQIAADKAIADAVAQLARQQQGARDRINDLSQQLTSDEPGESEGSGLGSGSGDGPGSGVAGSGGSGSSGSGTGSDGSDGTDSERADNNGGGGSGSGSGSGQGTDEDAGHDSEGGGDGGGSGHANGSGSGEAGDAETSDNGSAKDALANDLADATREFADAQRATGEGAQQMSAQQRVANDALSEALEMASRLTPNTESLSPDKSKTPQADDRGAATDGDLMDSAMGNDFVPASPEATAEAIAGPAAMEAARNAQRRAAERADDGSTKESDEQASRGGSQDLDSSPAGSDSEENDAQDASDGQDKRKPSDSRNSPSDGRPNDSDTEGREMPWDLADSAGSTGNQASGSPQNRKARQGTKQFNEAWFAELPATLREAIRAKSTRPPPKGYEDKLRRYFEQ